MMLVRSPNHCCEHEDITGCTGRANLLRQYTAPTGSRPRNMFVHRGTVRGKRDGNRSQPRLDQGASVALDWSINAKRARYG
jgi:hypothetical protein